MSLVRNFTRGAYFLITIIYSCEPGPSKKLWRPLASSTVPLHFVGMEKMTRAEGRFGFGLSKDQYRSERHFFATLNYVHNNPVKHGYVEKWQDWPYSSASEYLMKMGRETASQIWKEYPVLDYGNEWDRD